MINIIKGSDRQFVLKITRESTGEPFDLTGLTGTDLSLQLPGEDANLVITLTENANGSKLELTAPTCGKITVILGDVDTALLATGENEDMELTIKEGAGPDFEISIVQFENALTIKESVFA